MENNSFIYVYSAERNKEVEIIRKKYLPQEENKLETLKRLDCKVQNAGIIESLCVGIIGALVFGTGICRNLGIFGNVELMSVLLYPLGLTLMLSAYSIYKQVKKRKREELVPEILRLSEEIMNTSKN